MFTGIITHQSKILTAPVEGVRNSHKLVVTPPEPLESAFYQVGESIALDGVCLTLTSVETSKDSLGLAFDVSEETLKCVAPWTQGRYVNVERALKVGDRLGGHFVLGHVDGTAVLIRSTQGEESIEMVWEAPSKVEPYLFPKGSVTINGVSLTIQGIAEGDKGRGYLQFRTVVIPHTALVTNLGQLKPGDRANIEADYLAKVVRDRPTWP